MCEAYDAHFWIAMVLGVLVLMYLAYDFGKQQNEPPF
jgi:hypothetical protein